MLPLDTAVRLFYHCAYPEDVLAAPDRQAGASGESNEMNIWPA